MIGPIWGGWWFWEAPPGKTRESIYDAALRDGRERLRSHKSILASVPVEELRALAEMAENTPIQVGRTDR